MYVCMYIYAVKLLRLPSTNVIKVCRFIYIVCTYTCTCVWTGCIFVYVCVLQHDLQIKLNDNIFNSKIDLNLRFTL